MQKDVIIIGAGLTGLSTAYYLNKAGLSLVLIEKDTRTGGVINSHCENGFLYESGPNTGVISHPEVKELFDELYPYCELITANPKAKRRLIWKGKKWHAIPSGLISAIATPLYTISDKFRVLGEPWRKPGNKPMENLSDLVCRRLGKSFLDYTVDPFVSGVYAGDTDYLIPKYALPKLYNLEQQYGSFIKGTIAKAKEKKNNPRLQKATKEVFSAKGGLQKLVDALTAKTGTENILTACEKTTVEPHAGGYRIETTHGGQKHVFTSKIVITTVGAHALASLLPFLNNETLAPVTQLKYARIVQAIVGFKHWDGCNINAFGGLVPSKEKKPLLGVLFTSSFFEGRAPEKGALLSVFMGGTRRPDQFDLSDREISDLLSKQLPTMMNLKEYKPDLLRIFRYPYAIPQYGADSKERFECIEEIQKKHPGLILAGNIRNGIGMADRILQAKTIADLVSQKV